MVVGAIVVGIWPVIISVGGVLLLLESGGVVAGVFLQFW